MTQQALKSTRFGTIEFSKDDIVEFVSGLVGFEELRSFIFIEHGENSPFRWMQSLDDPNVAFLVIDPIHYVPEYAPEMPQATADRLDLGPGTGRLVYTIVTIPPGRPEEMTINLAGPIIINAERRIAQQIVVEDETYSVKHRVFEQQIEEEVA
ncbi:MAG: flagellar assembly protein FliW [Armatimonadetes bacterium]|nr:flagellar assembly protein FliW [Armatimonadota bacterium]